MEKQFVCDLVKCKGGCCEDGDAGAPLELDELDELIHNYETLKPYHCYRGFYNQMRFFHSHAKYISTISFQDVSTYSLHTACI